MSVMDFGRAPAGQAAPDPRHMIRMQAAASVLGTILQYPEMWPDVAFLRPEHMPHPAYAAVLGAIHDAIAAGERASPLIVARRLSGTPGVDPGTILSLTTRVDLMGLSDHAETLYSDWHWAETARIAELAQCGQATREDMLAHKAELDAVITGLGARAKPRHEIGAIASDLLKRVSDIASGSADSGILPTFSRDLDEQLGGGFRRGELVVTAGRPGMGKSIFGLCAARKIAKGGHGVIVFSLEISADQVAARMIADELSDGWARVGFGDILAARTPPEADGAIATAADDMHMWPMVIDTRGGISVAEIVSGIRQAAATFRQSGHELRLVVIDYLGLVASSDRYRGNRVQEIAEQTAALKAIARELEITVLLLAQINRGVESREDKRPTLSDLRDSGAIEQDADVVMFLYREEYYAAQKGQPTEAVNQIEVIVSKNRPGATGRVRLFCDPAMNAIRDLARV